MQICQFLLWKILKFLSTHLTTYLLSVAYTCIRCTRTLTLTSQAPSCCSVVIYYPFCAQWSHEISLAFVTHTHPHGCTHTHSSRVFFKQSSQPATQKDLFGLISIGSPGSAQQGKIHWMDEGRMKGLRLSGKKIKKKENH